LVDPDTMMIEFLDTHITHTTMFAAGRFFKFTSATLHFRLVHHHIILESFLRLPFGLICDIAGVDLASLIVTVVTGEHQYRTCVSMVVGNVRTG
jgi:hypothetical protein